MGSGAICLSNSPQKVELILNIKTAQVLGLTFPSRSLAALTR
jgi:hypothetical protein